MQVKMPWLLMKGYAEHLLDTDDQEGTEFGRSNTTSNNCKIDSQFHHHDIGNQNLFKVK